MAVPQEVICLQRSHFLSLWRSLEGGNAAIGFNFAPPPPPTLMSRAALAEATAPFPRRSLDVFPLEFKNE